MRGSRRVREVIVRGLDRERCTVREVIVRGSNVREGVWIESGSRSDSAWI